jgi:hypothetical protein
MNQSRDACENCRESIEMYVAGELGGSEAREVRSHLAACGACAEHHAEQRALIESLRSAPDALEPVRPIVITASEPAGSPRSIVVWKAVAAIAACFAVLAISALTVPAFAEQIPVLPVTAKLEKLAAERARLQARTEALSEQVEELQIKIKELDDGQKVPEVDSAGEGAVSAEVNDAVQKLAMDFIKAQYRGDKAALKSMATARLDAMIDENPDEYLKEPGSFVFAQLTTVSKSPTGTFLVFIRLSDSEFKDSTYQEDFEIKFEGGRYLVDFAGMDA